MSKQLSCTPKIMLHEILSTSTGRVEEGGVVFIVWLTNRIERKIASTLHHLHKRNVNSAPAGPLFVIRTKIDMSHIRVVGSWENGNTGF